MDALGTTCHDHFKKEVQVSSLKTVTPLKLEAHIESFKLHVHVYAANTIGYILHPFS